MQKKFILGLTAVLITAFPVAAFAGEAKEVQITMDQVPATVQKAVAALASKTEIKNIEASDAEDTKVFEFDIEKNGKKSELAFRPDGRLFSTEEEIPLAEVPEAVRKTIAQKSRKAQAGIPEKIVQEGRVSYEIVIERKGKKIEYTISPAGKITDRETVGKD